MLLTDGNGAIFCVNLIKRKKKNKKNKIKSRGKGKKSFKFTQLHSFLVGNLARGVWGACSPGKKKRKKKWQSIVHSELTTVSSFLQTHVHD